MDRLEATNPNSYCIEIEKTTPTIVHDLMNVEPPTKRLKQMQIKLWCNYIRAPNYLLKNESFENWVEFVNTHNNQIHGGSINTRSGNVISSFNPNPVTHIKNSPITRAYNTIREILPPNEPIQMDVPKQATKAPPCYTTQLPNTITVYEQMQEYSGDNYTYIPYENTLDIFVDGSCMPNNGPGGCACYFPDFEVLNNHRSIDHFTNSNYCELAAVELALLALKESESEFDLNDNNIDELTFIPIKMVIDLFHPCIQYINIIMIY